MTTELSKPVVRRTTGTHRGRQLVVTLLPGDVISVRHARSRTSYEMPLAWVYDAAVKAEVEQKRRAKAKTKKKR